MNLQQEYDKLPDKLLELAFEKLAEKQHELMQIITHVPEPQRIPENELIALQAVNSKIEEVFRQIVNRNKWRDSCYHCGNSPEQHPHTLCDLSKDDVIERIRIRATTGIIAVDELIQLRDTLFKI